MRITNSMLVSNYLNDLNSSMTRLSKFQSQLYTGKTAPHLRDDPMTVIFSQQAQRRLNRLEHYQNNVQVAYNWTTQTETTTREISELLASAYEACIDASTNVKSGYDLVNVGSYLEQVRNQLLSALNSTYGEKYLYGGYNTTGYIDSDDRVVSPFTVEYITREEQKTDYKGDPLFDIGNMMYNEDGTPMLDSGGAIMYDGTGDPVMWTVTEARLFYNGFDLSSFLELYNPTAAAAGEDPWTGVPGYDPSGPTPEDRWADVDRMILYSQYYDEAEAELGNDPWTAVPNYDPSGATEAARWAGVSLADSRLSEILGNATVFNSLMNNVLTIDVGTGVPMEIQINGLDLIFYDKNDYSKNIFNLIQDVYDTINRGAEVDDITDYIPQLQAASNHVLAKVATIGGKVNRLEMLESRYSQDYLNYKQMKSDAEDVDMSEAIMNYKMAEAVYNAALASGSYIIQQTLMNFLR